MDKPLLSQLPCLIDTKQVVIACSSMQWLICRPDCPFLNRPNRTFLLNTDLVERYPLNVQASLIWPAISQEDPVVFPVTHVGKDSVSWLTEICLRKMVTLGQSVTIVCSCQCVHLFVCEQVGKCSPLNYMCRFPPSVHFFLSCLWPFKPFRYKYTTGLISATDMERIWLERRQWALVEHFLFLRTCPFSRPSL